jgi:hypothetical protein
MFALLTSSDTVTRVRSRLGAALGRPAALLHALALPLALLGALALTGCDSTSTEDEPATIATLPSDQLQRIASDSSDFTWDVYAEELIVELTAPDPARDCTSVQMASIRAVGSDSGEPDIVGTTQTEPVTVAVEELVVGMKTTDLYSVPGLRPLAAEEQFSTSTYFPIPSNQFIEGDPINPQEAPGLIDDLRVTNEVLGDRELGPDQAVVIVYAFAPGGVPLYDRIAPLGLILERR